MELIEQINTQTNVYVDIENLVQYLFIGWDRILPKEEKQQLVAKFPHTRRIALAKFFENALLDAADNFPQTELKIISRQQAEESAPAVAAPLAVAAPPPVVEPPADTAPPAAIAPPADTAPPAVVAPPAAAPPADAVPSAVATP